MTNKPALVSRMEVQPRYTKPAPNRWLEVVAALILVLVVGGGCLAGTVVVIRLLGWE